MSHGPFTGLRFSCLGWVGLFLFFNVLPGYSREGDVPKFSLCPRIELFAEIDPALNSIEQRLVCGDPDLSQHQKPGEEERPWKTIPLSQALYHLKIFLQERGYLHPRFERMELLDHLWVRPGPKTFVKRVALEDGSESVDIRRKRNVLGRPMTPDLLNELEKWVAENLKKAGYPCPLVRAEANSELGEVILRVRKGEAGVFGKVTQEPIPGVVDQVLRRYDAFQSGERFNGELLSIAESRVASSGMVESARFSAQCSGSLEQSVISGAPRLMMSRIGLNTEGVVLGSFSWRNARLGRLGSYLDLSASGSARRQSLVALMNLYYDPSLSRAFFLPQLNLIHRNELQFENIETSAQVGWSMTQDSGRNGWSYFLGPILNLSKTLRGRGALETQILSLEGKVVLKSHDFEFYSDRPQSGYQSEATVDLSHRSILSQVTAQRFYLKGESLWNLWNLDPPLWVIGLRGAATTILASRLPSGEPDLPADLFQYLGGSHDLRGFGRLEISESPKGGAISSIYLGIEARLGGVISFGIDPFVFFDLGKLGSQSFSLDSPLYWAPGFGLRWASPVGALRGTLAHGFSNGAPQHWQFYFSFGEEF